MTGVPLDEVVHFDEVTQAADRSAADADSTPTFSVFEEATDTPILSAQNFTKRTSLTGNYRGTFTVSAANGFEVGKWYNVVSSATVGGVSGKKKSMTFRCVPAESSPGVPKADVTHWRGEEVPATEQTGVPVADMHYVNGTGFTPTVADLDDVKAETAAIKTVTDALSPRLPGSGTISTHAAADVVTAIGTGSTFTAVPWNAAWDAEVQSEVADALVAYDPPTNAEMEARTLAAASYALASQIPAGFSGVTITSGVLPADVKKVNAVTLQGAGVDGNSWRPA